MSKVYRKNKETRRYELKHRVTLIEIALIILLLAFICQLAMIGLAAASGGWTGILAKLVKVETLKAVETALESVRKRIAIRWDFNHNDQHNSFLVESEKSGYFEQLSHN